MPVALPVAAGPRPGTPRPSGAPEWRAVPPRGLGASERRGLRPGTPEYPILGDPAGRRHASSGLAAGGALPRHRPEPGGEVPRAREGPDVAADRGRDQRGGDRPDARDRGQAPSRVVVPSVRDDPPLQAPDPLRRGATVLARFDERFTRPPR